MAISGSGSPMLPVTSPPAAWESFGSASLAAVWWATTRMLAGSDILLTSGRACAICYESVFHGGQPRRYPGARTGNGTDDLAEPVAAFGDDHGAATHDHALDAVRSPLDPRAQERRAPHLDALMNLDLLAPFDQRVPGQVQRQRPGCGAGGGVLGNPPPRGEVAGDHVIAGQGEH